MDNWEVSKPPSEPEGLAVIEGMFSLLGIPCSGLVLGALKHLWRRAEDRVSVFGRRVQKELDAAYADGKMLRTDWFPEVDRESAPGAEVAERALFLARDEIEAKKIPYQSLLFVRLLLDTEYDVYEAHRFLRVFAALSYRQLCVLALAFFLHCRGERLDGPDSPWQGKFDRLGCASLRSNSAGRLTYGNVILLNESMDLVRLGLLRQAEHLILNRSDVKPISLRPDGMAFLLIANARLWNIPDSDISPLVRILSAHAEDNDQ